MITNNELNAVTLSATKKDYYQIWNELLEIAGKISNRWNPAHANESDPGVVLLKVLTAIADKLNYNIDVNTLEAFMPTAAQEESMRNLCEMMGYNMKYYQSAMTEIVMNFVGDKSLFTDKRPSITLPMFSSITNAEKDVNYVTLEAKNFSADLTSQNILCIEGQHVLCETINNNIVTIELLDDNNRFYLPETQIAENGIFVYSIKDGIKSDRWEKRTNLYTERLNTQVYKFGYDSREARPYLQFPEDISQIIGDGLEIHYIRTSGNAGNIAALTLNTFELPSDWANSNTGPNFTAQDFTIYNLSAAQSGANKESITAAYENYKKTIGTFDTLVTCRDYMNKIYSLMEDDNTPMVSNIMVSDIRSDINRAIVLCSFNDFGVCYKEQPIIDENNKALIDHFDLILYPFKTVYGNNNQSEYTNSFKLYKDNGISIEKELENNKTIAHKIKYPEDHEIVAIKNYLRLDAKITTTEKVNLAEEIIILDAIKKEIYTKFNMRKMEFGEEIPFESILDTIESAHPKIKNVLLNEPVLYTKFLLGDGTEYDLSSAILTDEGNIKFLGKELYNKLALRNILAGRIELFNYNTDFSYALNESRYEVQTGTGVKSYPAMLPDPSQAGVPTSIQNITRIEPKFSLKLNADGKFISASGASSNYQLTKNQEIKFRCPNFVTDITYPAYVNYYLKLSNKIKKKAVAAEFLTIAAFMTKPVNADTDYWDNFYNYLEGKSSLYLTKAVEDAGNNPFKRVPKNYITEENRKTYNQLKSLYGAIWTRTSTTTDPITYRYTRVELNGGESYMDEFSAQLAYYYLPIDDKTFIIWKDWLKTLNASDVYGGDNNFVLDIYRSLGANATRQIGYLVDAGLKKYQICNVYHSFTNYLIDYYVPKELGVDAVLGYIEKNTEYQLKQSEYLFINYTPSKTTTAEDGTQTSTTSDPKNIIYGPGSIIKPNFDLADSAALKQTSTKRWTKTNDINFASAEKHGVFKAGEAIDTNIDGMFGLSANEKIEHRNMVYVSINKPYFMYWIFKNGITDTDGTSRVNEEIKNHGKYTLQEGEYLFITGASDGSPKVDMAYYGNGTEINVKDRASNDHPENFFNTNLDTSIALDDILINGVAGIPWQYYSFSNDQYLLIREYQYLTLGEGDIITSLDISSTEVNKNEVNKNWQKVDAASYIMNGESKTLPIIDINENLLAAAIDQEAGQTIDYENLTNRLNSTDGTKLVSWEVKSVLHLKTDNNNCFVLSENEELVIIDDTTQPSQTSQTIAAKTDAQGKVIPVQIQSNISIDSTQDSISTISVNYDDFGNKEELYNFKLKISKSNTLGVNIVENTGKEYIDSSLLKLHDFGKNLTSLNFNNFKNNSCFLDININIPSNCYGLMMIYYTGETDNKSGAHIYYKAKDAEEKDIKLKIFNNIVGETESWWSGCLNSDESEYDKAYLQRGVNVIKIDHLITNLRIYGDTDLKNSIIISDLDAVYTETETISDLNLNLIDYQLNGDWDRDSNADLAAEVVLVNKNTKKATYYAEGIPHKIIEGLGLKNSDNYEFYVRTKNTTSIHKQIREELLRELNKLDIDHQFYYNCIVNNSVALNINSGFADTEEAEKLSTPRIWYDSNNINNKFVISEIDANWLENKNGIMIARSSKR